MQTDCISSIGVKWRQFKTTLNRKFIQPYISKPELLEENPTALDAPPVEYDSIEQTQWEEFVASRTTPEFLVSFEF